MNYDERRAFIAKLLELASAKTRPNYFFLGTMEYKAVQSYYFETKGADAWNKGCPGNSMFGVPIKFVHEGTFFHVSYPSAEEV